MKEMKPQDYQLLAVMLNYPLYNAPFETTMEKYGLCSNDGKYLHINENGIEELQKWCEDQKLIAKYNKPLPKIDKPRRK
jgi:hypothetical protein